jgi:hypothetical protein
MLEGTCYQTFQVHLNVVGMTVKGRSTTRRSYTITSRSISFTFQMIVERQNVFPVAGVVSSAVPNVISCHSSCWFHTTSLYLTCCSHQDWPAWLMCLTHRTCVWETYSLSFGHNSSYPNGFPHSLHDCVSAP